MAIALTYLERWHGTPRNSVSLIDRSGEIVMTYAKVHTCDFDMEVVLTPGDDFYVCSQGSPTPEAGLWFGSLTDAFGFRFCLLRSSDCFVPRNTDDFVLRL